MSQCFNDVEEPGSIDFLIKFEPLGKIILYTNILFDFLFWYRSIGTSLPDEKTLVNHAIEALTKFTNESFTRFTIPTVFD